MLDTKYLLGIVLLLIGFWPTKASGQYRDTFENHEWLYGKVYLTSGDSLQGPVVYHPALDVVQIASEDGTVSSLSPVNVSHFTVAGVYRDKPQLFRALFWNQGKQHDDFKKPMFFEQVCSGKLVLIRRFTGIMPINKEAASMKESSQRVYYPHFIGTPEEIQEDYYALLPDGEIVQLRNRRRNLQQLFGDKSGQVKRYVKTEKLDYNNPKQLIAIVDYFNTL
jgi:hypothetical protein